MAHDDPTLPTPSQDATHARLMQELANAAYELADFTHFTLYGVARSPGGYVPSRSDVEAALRQFNDVTTRLAAVEIPSDDPEEGPDHAP